MKRLYHRDGNWYEPSSSTATTGDLDKILKNSTRKITFEEWLKENGIDPNNLEETLKYFMEDEVSEEDTGTDDAGVTGKHYRIALQGDSLLLYMPVEKMTGSEATKEIAFPFHVAGTYFMP